MNIDDKVRKIAKSLVQDQPVHRYVVSTCPKANPTGYEELDKAYHDMEATRKTQQQHGHGDGYHS
jgi:hypothetical protein